MKRLFDLVVSVIGLVLLSPLLLAVTLLILVRMGRPVLFRQERAGRHGRPFTLVKFRTMTRDHDGGTVSVRGEPRITSLGATLRKFKLDELPELWNVLLGEMSMVGPRPDVPEYAARLEGEDLQILELRPGITGPATLKYAREEDLLASVPDAQKYNDEVLWPDKVKINLEYYHNHNFFRDLGIIFRTLFSKSG